MLSGKRVDETDEAFGEEWTKEFIYYVYLGKRKIELNVFLIYIYLLNTIILSCNKIGNLGRDISF